MNLLITGGTGTFGGAFVRLWLRETSGGRVVIFSRDEFKQLEMEKALRAEFPDDTRLHFLLGDMRDEKRLRRVLANIDVVIHAAALKQVPIGENNPTEVVKTNVLGALNLVEAAIDCQVQSIMALSSDKSVSSLNLYGASKKMMESLLIQANVYSPRTRFACCRYGNVWGSRGSVIPLWREQAKQGRITLTSPEMTRFWITIEQATRFIYTSLAKMQGGEIFVPKLPSFSMGDLASVVAPGIEQEIIGLRPGEKMHEALIAPDEARQVWELPDRYIVYPGLRLYPISERGIKVPGDFLYSSDNNPQRLNAEQLAAWVKE